jgi:Fungal potassium channel
MLAWLRILLAEGPRNVINALTLYSVMQLELIPVGDQAAKDGQSPIAQFFVNVGLLVDKSGREQAVILFAMLFTLMIWVVTLINLLVAVLLYLLFLFHHIPSSDRGLTGYCRRKINKSMEAIVKTKVDKALRKENELRAREEARGSADVIKRQPTLPNLYANGDEKPSLLSRQTTLTTLPEYSSRPGTSAGSALTSPSDLERQPTLPDLNSPDFRPAPMTRVGTHASSSSWTSHGSNAPLMGAAGEMGYGAPGQIQSPGGVSSPGSYSSRAPANRSYTGYSHSAQRSYTPGMGSRPGIGPDGRSTPGTYHMEPVSRSGSVMSGQQIPGFGASPADSYGRRTPGEQNNPYFPSVSDASGRGSSATLPRSNTPGNASMRSHTPGASSSTRSITPATPSYRPYTPGQPPLPRLHTSNMSGGEGHQNYSASSQSPAQSAFPPRTLYRSYTQPNMGAVATDQYSQQPPNTSQRGYEPQQQAGHAPPTPRSGTAPPTNRQRAPVADSVMEDIMNGY